MNLKNPKVLNIGLIVLGLILLSRWQSYLKLLGIVLLALGVYRFMKGRAPAQEEQDPERRAQDAAASREMTKLRSMARICKLLFYVICVVVFVLAIMWMNGGSMVPAIVMAILGVVLKTVQECYEGKLQDYISENLAKTALCQVFEVQEYRDQAKFNEGYVKNANLDYGDFSGVACLDYISGAYHGMPLELGDLRIYRTVVDEHSTSITERSDYDTFKGIWVVCRFGRPDTPDFRIMERGKMGKLMGASGVRTGDEAFDRQFRIDGDDAERAASLLTPAVTAAVASMDAAVGGDTRIRFHREGVVQIAIQRGSRLFDVGTKGRNAAELRRQFIAALESIAAVLDALQQTDTM